MATDRPSPGARGVSSASRFAEARTHTSEAKARLEALTRTPISQIGMPAAPAVPQVGQVVGDMVITTTEEQLIASIQECKSSPGKTEIVLEYIEEALRSGELRFTHSRTHATKARRP